MIQAEGTGGAIAPDLEVLRPAAWAPAVGPLLQCLSHDLRSALQAMNGWLQLLQVDGIDEGARAQALAGLNRSIAAQIGLAERLRLGGAQFEATAHEASRPPSIPGPTCISPLIGQCIAQATPSAQRRSVDLLVAIPDPGLMTPLAHPALEFIVNSMLEAAIAGASVGGTVALSASVAPGAAHSMQLAVRSLPTSSSTAPLARHDLSTLLAQQLAQSIGARFTLPTAASLGWGLSLPMLNDSAAPLVLPLRRTRQRTGVQRAPRPRMA